ncbi:FecR family protein [Achromobacter aloeverae]|uniref:Iron dicitrate transport regulator FecR n=1 Tax=Achromobacter aloeverae TaxID=1750518 RepID=A0A4Q1HMX2_9BURK|nr:FecR domain-containing protein [Achromobacter aloeverae]RXN92334.1 iron dicitrate transport regulator FecR [Achromobacter aloeverae]
MTHADDALALHEAAAEWYLRRQAADWSQADQAELDAWLQADPRHGEAMSALSRTWLDFSGVTRPALASDAKARATIAARAPSAASHGGRDHRHAGRPWHSSLVNMLRSPRVAGTLAACLVLAGAGGWFAYDNFPTYKLDVATAHGETRTLDLPDGSRIAVNMDTQLSVRIYPRRREVRLQRGEAWFQVAHAPAHPFTVASGDNEVRVTGTVFDVRNVPGRTTVQVREGRVEVRGARHCGEPAVLTASQAITMGGNCSHTPIYGVTTDMVGDWREGQLVFRRTTLEDVALELARYLGKPVRVADPRVRALPVSGFASTARPAAFLESLPDLLPVRVTPDAGGGYRIEPAAQP